MKATDIKKELLSKVNQKDAVQVEKVERYMNLLEIYYSLDESIKADGTMVVTENGAQRFIKPNPAISEKNKISGSLLALEKSFGFDDEPKTKKRASLV